MSVVRNPCRYCASSFYSERTKRRSPSFNPECTNCERLKEHKQYLQTKRMFVEGKPITTLDELLKHEWVMWFHSTRHIEVIKSATVRTVQKWLDIGAVHEAIRKDKLSES